MAGKIDNVFVVKVQVSEASSDGLVHLLVYNRSKEYMVELEFPSKEAIALIGLEPVPKSFYIAQLVDDKNEQGSKRINILERVKDEDW
jgi:hypothetical protein